MGPAMPPQSPLLQALTSGRLPGAGGPPGMGPMQPPGDQDQDAIQTLVLLSALLGPQALQELGGGMSGMPGLPGMQPMSSPGPGTSGYAPASI